MTTMLRPKNQVTLPTSLTQELGWKVGDRLDVVRENDRLVVIAQPLACVPATRTWAEFVDSGPRLALAEGTTVAELLAADREE
ncbi:MAG: AbrB/MazE/SpoVT family DNA-binding domain-containing protein [Micrococcales bacterium]|nr:AbrB/MazE/SpoVT family DNA-binding domain-containing protein [Micrococcales bacterium]